MRAGSARYLLPRMAGEGGREAVEGARLGAVPAVAPSVTSPMAPRHLPRFTGEEQ
jgi:hypothetical protein